MKALHKLIFALTMCVSLSVQAATTVTVAFRGLIAHVLGDSIGRPSRSIVIKDPLHTLYLFFPEGIDTDELAKQLPVTIPELYKGYYKIEMPDGFSVRVVGIDDNKNVVSQMSPALNTDDTFRSVVPGLEKVSNGTLKPSKLSETVFDGYPDPNRFAMFFFLDGGTLHADRFPCKGKFKKGYVDKDPRYFACRVTLTGTLDVQPAVQFLASGDAKWRTVPFKKPAPQAIRIGVQALPPAMTHESHFPKFEKLGRCCWTFDDIESTQDCVGEGSDCKEPYDEIGTSGTDPSCTNSTWP
jgi:hypothetical protein